MININTAVKSLLVFWGRGSLSYISFCFYFNLLYRFDKKCKIIIIKGSSYQCPHQKQVVNHSQD